MENNLKDQHYKNMGIMLQMDTLTFEAETPDATTNACKIDASGSFFNSSFGIVDNTLSV